MLARVSEIWSGGGTFLPVPWVDEGRCRFRPSVMCKPVVYANHVRKKKAGKVKKKGQTFFEE